MKGSLKLAKRYSRALLGLYELNDLEGVRDCLREVSSLWDNDKQLSSVLLNPAFPLADREACLREIASRIKPDDSYFSNFLAVLMNSGRISLLPLITETFSEMIDHLKKLLALEITSANPVNSDEMEQLKTKIEKDFGSLASIKWDVDADLIGGMQVRSGDRLLDGTIRGKLDRLQANLL